MLLQSERGSWRVSGGLRNRAAHPATSPSATNTSISSHPPQSAHLDSTSSTDSETNSDDDAAVATKQTTKTTTILKIDTQKDMARDSKIIYEFGGPLGVTFLMIGFPILMSYLYICLTSHAGHLINPFQHTSFWSDGLPSIYPNTRAIAIYLGFNIFQYISAATLPGVTVLGLPVPSLGGKQLEYLCNGVATWYLDLVLVAFLHVSGYFPITSKFIRLPAWRALLLEVFLPLDQSAAKRLLTVLTHTLACFCKSFFCGIPAICFCIEQFAIIELKLVLIFIYPHLFAAVVDEIGPIMSVAMIWGLVVTLATYAVGVISGRTHRMSGSIPYDIFMGAVLNPRIFNVDLKCFSEIRISWKLLFFISLSAAVKDHEINVERNYVDIGRSPPVWSFGGIVEMTTIQTSSPLLFMLLAHFLYVNACMKGEECIPTTWDIFYEKWVRKQTCNKLMLKMIILF